MQPQPDSSFWPAPKTQTAYTTSVVDGAHSVLVAVTNPLLMAVVFGFDVTASQSGTSTEFFTLDVYDGGNSVFRGSIFGNQVSPPTGLSFSWRGFWPVYSNQVIRLTSVAGPWFASAFGFLTSADNLPH